MSINQRARKKYGLTIDLNSLFEQNPKSQSLSTTPKSKATFRPPAQSFKHLPSDDYSFKTRETIPKSSVHGIPKSHRLQDRLRRHTTVVGPGIMLSQDEYLPLEKNIQPDSEATNAMSNEILEIPEDSLNYASLADHFQSGIPLEDFSQGRERYYRKKYNQWRRWTEEIIPSLIPVYHNLLESTRSWRDFPPPSQPSSTCLHACGPRQLKVLCIQWEETRLISVPICACTSVAETLLNHGFFPCSPLEPSLAVDVRMLEFIHELFLRISPNNTAWCETLETILTYRGFSLPGKSTFRRRFANAVFWFNHLLDRSNQHLEELMDRERYHVHGCTPVCETMTAPSLEEDIDEVPVIENAPGESGDSVNSLRASYYLRARCPLCFGGDLIGSELPIPDVITQIDACFGQCRRDIGRDPPVKHSHCHFLSEDCVEAMRIEVEERRPPKKVGPDKRKRSPIIVEDEMEPIGLPTSVLDACEKTFEAADERRQKASTRIFKDTGLMALLCRHDRVLFVANMQTAGEKQFYVFALLKALFQHLPPKANVGLLYDIGCAIHRSITKWNFLSEYQNRLVFALSIFHAYGHEWPCQLRYAPRLAEGFGLSNGEGCERFWSSIKALIPNLRISGHHRRLYTLDMQIDFLDSKASPNFGSWISKQYNRAENMILESQTLIDQSEIAEQVLRQQWQEQLKAQIKPLPNQNKRRGKSVVEATLAARERLRLSEEELQKLKDKETRIISIDPTSDLLDELEIKLQEMARQRDLKQQSVEKLERSLGIEHKKELARLKNNRYLQLRMNTRALKQRLRDRLRQRKFELARVERSYRHSVNERKLVDHAEGVINKRLGTITETARAYNSRCKEIATMIEKKQAPRWACAPQQLDLKKLFTLDVDHEIWQDVGLEDDTDGPPPPWLADVKTRAGIRALLDRDRALEERNRLEQELRHMQTWIHEELEVLNRVLQQFEDSEAIIYSLNQHRNHLLNLGNIWRLDTRLILIGTWPNIPENIVVDQSVLQDETVTTDEQPQLATDDGDESEEDEEYELMEDEGLLEAIQIMESVSDGERRRPGFNNDEGGLSVGESEPVSKRFRTD